ncbi:MAG: efflux RND transporter periplasmic adaptor subunit [Bacteroidia bacterium]
MTSNKIQIILLVLLSIYGCSEKGDSESIINSETEIKTDGNFNSEKPELIIDSSELIISCMGKVAVPPSSKIEITAGIDANVFDIQVLPGSYIKKGDLLARIKNRAIITLQSQYVVAKTQLQNLKNDFNRKESLFNEKAISEKEYIQSKSLFESKLAETDGFEAELSYIGVSPKNIMENGIQKSIAIRSKVNGTVVSVNTNEGAFASNDQSLFTLIDNSNQHLDLDVFAKDVSHLEVGQQVVFTVNGTPVTYNGVISLISGEISPTSNTLMVHAEIDQSIKTLISGSRVQANINAGNQKRFWLNEKWISQDNGTYFIDFNNSKTQLTLGSYENGFYQILNYEYVRSKF